MLIDYCGESCEGMKFYRNLYYIAGWRSSAVLIGLISQRSLVQIQHPQLYYGDRRPTKPTGIKGKPAARHAKRKVKEQVRACSFVLQTVQILLSYANPDLLSISR